MLNPDAGEEPPDNNPNTDHQQTTNNTGEILINKVISVCLGLFLIAAVSYAETIESASNAKPPQVNLKKEAVATANILSAPESVVYDSLHNRYLVSNVGSGNVVALTASDTTATPFRGVRGMAIRGTILYTVASDNEVRGYDLVTQDTVLSVTVPGALFLNDLDFDDAGLLYITDTDRSRIYKVNPATSQITNFVSAGVTYPNGIYFDGGNNRLLLCSWRINSPIQAVSLADSTVSTVVVTTLRNLDGITRDAAGNWYISSWYTQTVYRFNSSFVNPPDVFSINHNGPADIYYDRWHNLIAVPNFNSNSVDFVAVTGVEGKPAELAGPAAYSLSKCFPNPMKGHTTVKFAMPKAGKVNIAVYNIMDQKVKTLVDGSMNAGHHTVNWNGRNESGQPVSAGVYLYKMQADGFNTTQKLVVLK